MNFFCFYIILISAFLIRLIWTLVLCIQRIINPLEYDWIQNLIIHCFYNGCLYALIIEASKMFATETIVLCAISFILYRDTINKFKATPLLKVNDKVKQKNKWSTPKFRSIL